MPYVIKPHREGDGIVVEGVSGEVLSKYDLVFLSGGKWCKADADTSATLPAFALALNEFPTVDYAGLFLLYGLVSNLDWAWVDGPIYASTTPGGLTQTAPSETGWVQSVGISHGADYMLFSPMWIKELGVIGAPGIKMVKLTGTSPAGGANNTIAHGLDYSKIISATVLIENNSGNPIPPNFTSVGSHQFDFFIDADYVHIYCIAANSASIDNGNLVTVLIIYEE